MYEDEVAPSWFLLWWYLYSLVFSDQKNSISKNFDPAGFCEPEMLKKFWDFAAGMDFDT